MADETEPTTPPQQVKTERILLRGVSEAEFVTAFNAAGLTETLNEHIPGADMRLEHWESGERQPGEPAVHLSTSESPEGVTVDVILLSPSTKESQILYAQIIHWVYSFNNQRGMKLPIQTRQGQEELPIPDGDELLSTQETGPRAGTYERVREAHRLLKQAERETKSRAWAFRQARTDSRTYYKWCERATGEPPLLME